MCTDTNDYLHLLAFISALFKLHYRDCFVAPLLAKTAYLEFDLAAHLEDVRLVAGNRPIVGIQYPDVVGGETQLGIREPVEPNGHVVGLPVCLFPDQSHHGL